MADQRVFTPCDDRFHFEEMSDDWWGTETAIAGSDFTLGRGVPLRRRGPI